MAQEPGEVNKEKECFPSKILLMLATYHLFDLKNTVSQVVLVVTEKATAPHSSTLAWKILWTQEPGGLQSMGSLRVGHD